MSLQLSRLVRKSLVPALLGLGVVGMADAQSLDVHTRRNLNAAMHDEAYAALRYQAYAGVARAQGDAELAKLFEDAASDEANDHFRREGEALGLSGPTPQNLERAVDDEHYQSSAMYKRYAEEADKVGDKPVAELFRKIAADENQHFQKYKEALAHRAGNAADSKAAHE